MAHQRDDNRLSSGDALFLYLEREGMPLNVASVSVFKGVISLQACRRFIESKLPLIPRYRQHVVQPRFGIGCPTWEYDPDFDIRNHVREVTLKHGTEAELKSAAGVILSQLMDRRRPLWDFTLLRGLKGNRTGVVTRMHHCLADGLGGVSLMNSLMDSSPEVRPLAKRNPRFHMPARKKSATFLDEVITSSMSVAERVLTTQMELLNVFQHVLAELGGATKKSGGAQRGRETPPVGEFARFLPEISAATQALPFNIICRGPQNFRWAELPLADIKAVKNACAVKVNEVALTIVASAIQRYVEKRGVRVKGRLLRIVVPVNVRGGNVNGLGNHITFVPITIPLDIRNPRRLLSAIHKRTLFLKAAHLAECVGIAGTMIGTVPTLAQELVGPLVGELPLGLCNLIFTNVPGPQSPLYLLGHEMLRCYPYVPIGGEMGINCAVLTYNGTAYFGFTGDVHAAPDLARLEKLLTNSFAELWDVAGMPLRQNKRPGVRVKPRTASPQEIPDSIAPSPPKPTAAARVAVTNSEPNGETLRSAVA
jgi:diacylglycerol O-acyltransferase